MTEPDDLDGRVSHLEEEVADIRDRLAHTRADAMAGRTLAAGADHDVSHVRAELRAHKSVLNALRETQIEFGRSLHATHRSVSTLERDVGVLKVDVGVLKVDVGVLKVDVGVLKVDVGGLKEDVGGLKEDVGGLKEDVSGLKEDVSGLKEDVSGLKEDVGLLKVQVGDLDRRLVTVHDGVNKIVGLLERDADAP